jgi:nucleoside-diphosphate-sugar epimerase
MRVLITGAAGYIGGKFAAALLSKDWTETVVGTDLNPKPIPHPK